MEKSALRRFKMADNGLIRDAKTVGALYYLTRRLGMAATAQP